MTTNEAREAAWREWYRIAKHQPFLENVETGFNAGWNARGQHDKEQIAALREALNTYGQHLYDCADSPRRSHWDKRPRVCTCGLRALEGQSEAEEATSG